MTYAHFIEENKELRARLAEVEALLRQTEALSEERAAAARARTQDANDARGKLREVEAERDAFRALCDEAAPAVAAAMRAKAAAEARAEQLQTERDNLEHNLAVAMADGVTVRKERNAERARAEQAAKDRDAVHGDLRRVKAWILAAVEHGWKGIDLSAPTGVAQKWLERLLRALPDGPDHDENEDLKDRIDAGSLHPSRDPSNSEPDPGDDFIAQYFPDDGERAVVTGEVEPDPETGMPPDPGDLDCGKPVRTGEPGNDYQCERPEGACNGTKVDEWGDICFRCYVPEGDPKP